MARKIREQVEFWIRIYNEGHATYEELDSKRNELGDLIYKMWQNDLISDKVQKECYEELEALTNFQLKILMNKKN